MRDAAKNPVPDVLVPCMENSGISYAVPAQMIIDLAQANNINLD